MCAARHALAVALAGSACTPDRTLASCADDLTGVYLVEGEVGRRWHLVAPKPGLLEAYPLFDDVRGVDAPPGIEVAPRVIDLGERRTSTAPRGKVRRRFMHGADACTAIAPATIVACEGQTVELVLGEPAPPLAYRPCAFGAPANSRRVRWVRE